MVVEQGLLKAFSHHMANVARNHMNLSVQVLFPSSALADVRLPPVQKDFS